MKKTIRTFVFTAAVLAASAITTLAAPLLSVTPAVNNVTVGNSFVLFINIASVTDLFGWQVDVGFGPAGLLTATSYSAGGFLGAGTTGIGGTINNGAATITALSNSRTGFTGVSGSGVLASIMFSALTVGTATVTLSSIQLLDSNLDSIFPDPPTLATVNISAAGGIPEPSTFALLGLGLAMGAFLRRRA